MLRARVLIFFALAWISIARAVGPTCANDIRIAILMAEAHTRDSGGHEITPLHAEIPRKAMAHSGKPAEPFEMDKAGIFVKPGEKFPEHLADGKYVIITARLSNGEIVHVYSHRSPDLETQDEQSVASHRSLYNQLLALDKHAEVLFAGEFRIRKDHVMFAWNKAGTFHGDVVHLHWGIDQMRNSGLPIDGNTQILEFNEWKKSEVERLSKPIPAPDAPEPIKAAYEARLAAAQVEADAKAAEKGRHIADKLESNILRELNQDPDYKDLLAKMVTLHHTLLEKFPVANDPTKIGLEFDFMIDKFGLENGGYALAIIDQLNREDAHGVIFQTENALRDNPTHRKEFARALDCLQQLANGDDRPVRTFQFMIRDRPVTPASAAELKQNYSQSPMFRNAAAEMRPAAAQLASMIVDPKVALKDYQQWLATHAHETSDKAANLNVAEGIFNGALLTDTVAYARLRGTRFFDVQAAGRDAARFLADYPRELPGPTKISELQPFLPLGNLKITPVPNQGAANFTHEDWQDYQLAGSFYEALAKKYSRDGAIDCAELERRAQSLSGTVPTRFFEVMRTFAIGNKVGLLAAVKGYQQPYAARGLRSPLGDSLRVLAQSLDLQLPIQRHLP